MSPYQFRVSATLATQTSITHYRTEDGAMAGVQAYLIDGYSSIKIEKVTA